ncbi:MAG: glycosyltransferase family 2 protein [Flavobacteriales bacterium]|jgi:glycosyltransferase involved in cell wall biosynthesis|nr:MAG: glycosyltransferase family 2 protein [Flavobacteriales bacterium]
MTAPLISVIMPAYNAAEHVREAIMSVQAQTWPNWELVVVNDGSQDATAAILDGLDDARIIVVHQENKGVSAARNTGLDRARGEIIAFLDADDVLPARSLEARAALIVSDPEVFFVDGTVLRLDATDGRLTHMYSPSFKGMAFDRLVALSETCFFGPSWMIRRTDATNKRFPEHMRHGEDLAFYTSIARAGKYTFVEEPVLHYRQGRPSAMSDLKGLERGYHALFAFVQQLPHPPDAAQLAFMRARARRIMFRSYLKAGRPVDAVRSMLRTPPFPPQRRP